MSKKPNYRRIARTRWTKNKNLNIVISILVILALAFVVPKLKEQLNQSSGTAQTQLTNQDAKNQTDLAALEYNGNQTIQINNNNPGFTTEIGRAHV